MRHMKDLYDLSDLSKYHNVVITGGEPLLYPDRVTYTVHRLRSVLAPSAGVYLYTTLWHPVLTPLTRLIQGVTFTLHSGARHGVELEDFRKMQDWSLGNRHLSNRLVVYPHVPAIAVIPDAWRRITKDDYATEDELMCRNPNSGLPVGEDLYFYRGGGVVLPC
jgi:hypothetical protein